MFCIILLVVYILSVFCFIIIMIVKKILRFASLGDKMYFRRVSDNT